MNNKHVCKLLLICFDIRIINDNKDHCTNHFHIFTQYIFSFALKDNILIKLIGFTCWWILHINNTRTVNFFKSNIVYKNLLILNITYFRWIGFENTVYYLCISTSKPPINVSVSKKLQFVATCDKIYKYFWVAIKN